MSLPTRRRITQFDGLRALAFGAVFIHHGFHVPLLWAGVDCFFVLSGFLITGILLDARGRPGALPRFWTRRARRILPPYAICLALTTLILGVPWRTAWPWLAFFAANVGYSFYLPHDALVPLWSLAVEEQFYLLWPLVILLTTERTARRIAIALVITAPVLRLVCGPLFSTVFPIYFLTPFRVDLLAAGALLAMRGERIREASWREGAGAIAVGVGLMGALILLGYRTSGNSRVFDTFGFEAILAVFYGVVLLIATGRTGPAGRVLDLPPLRYVGRISYLAYLLHLPFIVWLKNPWAALAATLVCSAVSWELLEKRLTAGGGSSRTV